jgi:hypothetical protein
MSRMMENVATLNSAVRTMLAVLLVGVFGWGGWTAYRTYFASDIAAREQAQELEDARQELARRDNELREKVQMIAQRDEQLAKQSEEIASLNLTVQEQEEEIARLDTALRLLKVDHRIAHLEILDQKTDPESGEKTTTISFVEVNDEGTPIGPDRTFELKGDMVYIDHWVVKFEDKYVEEADFDRSTAIVLFRRIFGEYQEPSQGYTIDEVGSRPTAYARGSRMSDFERKIWDDFWNIANNPERAKELGIRAAHGEAVSIKAEQGRSYEVQLRATGGISITPLETKKEPQT